MIPVYQTIVSIEDGDCTRACLASILDLPIDAVPNFIRFRDNWFKDLLKQLVQKKVNKEIEIEIDLKKPKDKKAKDKKPKVKKKSK